jgi:chromosome segregation ATPase
MSSGFDANVPARRPRTRIGRVISELTSGVEEGVEGGDPLEVEDVVPAASPHGADRDHPGRAAGAESRANGTPVPRGRERIERLRERLAAAAHATSGAAEPKRTAEAVREMVDGLRARLDASITERAQLADALEEARAAVARAEAELRHERHSRKALEEQAEERRRIADDAVAEAEALAAERDQVLGELTDHRRLEGEQTSFLAEVEAALAQRDAEREAASRELAEALQLADLRANEAADLAANLQDETAGRARAEARCRDLEAEIARLSEARQALQSIEQVLGRSRGQP